MALFKLAFSKIQCMLDQGFVFDVMTIRTKGFQPSNVTLNLTSTYGSFIFHHGELRFSHPMFVSSIWTQRIRSLVNFITYLEPPYLLDYNYIVVPLPTGFFVSTYLNGEGVQEFLTLDIGIPWKSPPLINTLSTNALQP